MLFWASFLFLFLNFQWRELLVQRGRSRISWHGFLESVSRLLSTRDLLTVGLLLCFSLDPWISERLLLLLFHKLLEVLSLLLLEKLLIYLLLLILEQELIFMWRQLIMRPRMLLLRLELINISSHLRVSLILRWTNKGWLLLRHGICHHKARRWLLLRHLEVWWVLCHELSILVLVRMLRNLRNYTLSWQTIDIGLQRLALHLKIGALHLVTRSVLYPKGRHIGMSWMEWTWVITFRRNVWMLATSSAMEKSSGWLVERMRLTRLVEGARLLFPREIKSYRLLVW